MAKVLNLIWNGTVKQEGMDIQLLLDLLDTSNIIGLEYLNEGIKEYLENIFGSEKVDLEDCFVALDFAISKKMKVSLSVH